MQRFNNRRIDHHIQQKRKKNMGRNEQAGAGKLPDCKHTAPNPGIVQLTVAPRVNHRIRFSPLNGKNQSLIMPQAAVEKIRELEQVGSRIDGVLIYGPGDPLAEIELPLETVRLIRQQHPDLPISIRTLGIGGLQHADKLGKAGVTEVEVLVDAVEPAVMEKIYAWVRPGFKTLKLSEATATLAREQSHAIQAFQDAGLKIRIVSTLYPMVNDDQFELLAKKMAELGADEMVLHPYAPEIEADISLPQPSPELMATVVGKIANILPAIEGRPAVIETAGCNEAANNLPKPKEDRPNIAVVSSNGMEVDLHLGQAPQLLIYGPREDGLKCLLECRPAPQPGEGKERWDILAGTIPDCFALLAASAGDRPRRVLDRHGINVLITHDNIEGSVDLLYGGERKKGCSKKA